MQFLLFVAISYKLSFINLSDVRQHIFFMIVKNNQLLLFSYVSW